jgi:hypothetical protein
MSLITRKIYNGRTTEELIALLSAVACAILAALFIAALYFGREQRRWTMLRRVSVGYSLLN